MKYSMLCGMRIIIVQDVVIQNRRHKRKRINKKWRKRFGVSVHKRMKDGMAIRVGGNLYMNNDTYLELEKELVKEGEKINRKG